MNEQEKEDAFRCLLKLRDMPVPIQISDEQEKAYIDWHGSEERRQMLEAAISSLTEGIDPPPYNIYEGPQDLVNHPKHYQGKSLESINVIEDFDLGFHLGNAIKYILRAEKKGNKIQDLKKAIWYLERECVNVVAATADSVEEK